MKKEEKEARKRTEILKLFNEISKSKNGNATTPYITRVGGSTLPKKTDRARKQ